MRNTWLIIFCVSADSERLSDCTKEKLAIRAAMSENNVPKMLDLVTDDMIDALVLAGTPDEVRNKLKDFEELFETLILYCPMPWLDPQESKDNHSTMIETFSN